MINSYKEIILEEPSLEYINHMGDDCFVVNVARVSFAKEVDHIEPKDEKLIKYLAEHGHWSPFAHPKVSFRVANPIFLARQLVKHEIGKDWNEESRRYIDDIVKFYIPESIRGRPEGSIKQGSAGEMSREQQTKAFLAILDSYDQTNTTYNNLLEMGVCPEQARMVLPLGSMTHWIWTGSLYFWARVYNLRSDPHAQADLKPFVTQLDEHMSKLFPISWKALTH